MRVLCATEPAWQLPLATRLRRATASSSRAWRVSIDIRLSLTRRRRLGGAAVVVDQRKGGDAVVIGAERHP
jgi:hypothetical protein